MLSKDSQFCGTKESNQLWIPIFVSTVFVFLLGSNNKDNQQIKIYKAPKPNQ